LIGLIILLGAFVLLALHIYVDQKAPARRKTLTPLGIGMVVCMVVGIWLLGYGSRIFGT